MDLCLLESNLRCLKSRKQLYSSKKYYKCKSNRRKSSKMSECGPKISTMVFDSFHQPVAWMASNRKILQDGKNTKCLSWCIFLSSVIPFPFNTANDLTTYDWMEMKMLHFNSKKILLLLLLCWRQFPQWNLISGDFLFIIMRVFKTSLWL